jgi:hypothetical protein
VVLIAVALEGNIGTEGPRANRIRRLLRTQPVRIGLLIGKVGGVWYGVSGDAAQFVIEQLAKLTAGLVVTILRISAGRWQGPLLGARVTDAVQLAGKGLGAKPADRAIR